MALFTYSQIFFLLLGTALSIPNPLPTDTAINYNLIEERTVNCKLANAALTVLNGLGAPATSFCYSYLHIPSTATSTTTTTTSTVTITTSTTTVTTTQSTCPAAAKPKRTAEPFFVRWPEKEEIVKRFDIQALSKYAASQLSSGCSCLSLAPKTTTTKTVTPVPTTISVVATSTACATPPECIASDGFCTIDTFLNCCSQCCRFPDGDSSNGKCC